LLFIALYKKFICFSFALLIKYLSKFLFSSTQSFVKISCFISFNPNFFALLKISFLQSSKNSYIIFSSKHIEIALVIERFNIEKKISDSEKNYFFSIVDDYLKKGKKLEFKYENPYFALILSEILNDNVCFEKTSEIFINKRLNTLERCVYNNFNKNTINAYLIYIKEKKITSAISKCLDEKIIYEFLDDCKKDIFKSAKKLGLKEIKQEIFTKDCVELKRNLLKYFINNANEKQINFLYKAMKSKFFILGF